MINALLFYSTLISIFITVSGFMTAGDEASLSFQAIFLPITIGLILTSIKTIKNKGTASPNKLWVFYSFIVTTLFTVSGFSAARSITEFVVAYFFCPTFIYFLLQILPKRSKAIVLPVEQDRSIETSQDIKPAKEELPLEQGKVDRDRRAFVKLIGTAGTTIFLFSIFGLKKAEAAFFGSVPGPGTISLKDASGNKIDPAEKHPTDGYKINQLDDTSSATYSYFGFTNKSGAWFIMRETTSGVDVGQYRYTKGSSDFTNATTGWPNRAALTYDHFDNIF